MTAINPTSSIQPADVLTRRPPGSPPPPQKTVPVSLADIAHDKGGLTSSTSSTGKQVNIST